jgi:hypothetical protein
VETLSRSSASSRESIGVVLVVPTLTLEQQRGVEQLEERVSDQRRVAKVFQPLGEPARHPQPLENLALQLGAALRGQALLARLDPD